MRTPLRTRFSKIRTRSMTQFGIARSQRKSILHVKLVAHLFPTNRSCLPLSVFFKEVR
jgi:hypothetical protein